MSYRDIDKKYPHIKGRFKLDLDKYGIRVYDTYQEYIALESGNPHHETGLVPMSSEQIIDVLNKQEKFIGHLNQENYGLWGEITWAEDELDMLRESIITMKHVYELACLKKDFYESQQAKTKLEAINDIEQQLHLVKLREGFCE